MSFKYQAVKHGPNHYVLPKIGKMKVEAHAFLSDKLYQMSEESMWNQIHDSASYEGVIGAYLMPDCLSSDTEVLTPRGFIKITDLKPEDHIANVSLSTNEGIFWAKPKAVINRPLREGEKVFEHTFSSLNKSIITTEGHRHPFVQNDRIVDLTSKELPAEGVVVSNFVWPGMGFSSPPSGVDLLPEELKLVAWIVGDGNIKLTFNKNSVNKRIRFGFKKKRKIQKVTELLNEIGLSYTVSVSKKQTEIYINTTSSAKYIDIVGSEKKYPIKWISELTYAQAQILLKEMLEIDGDFENHHKMGSTIFFSSRESDANFISSIASIHYGAANVRWRDRSVVLDDKTYDSGYWKVSIIHKDNLELCSPNGLHNSKVITREVTYNDNVVCVTCNSGYFVARQNGLTFVTGNCHMGYGIPVGGVIVTEDTIIQSGSGYDISCGVVYLKCPNITAEDVSSHKKRDRWVRAVNERVALGVGSDRPELMRNFKKKEVDECLRFGAKALGIDADLCERQYIPIPKDIDLTDIEKAYNKALPQLGSVGGGNHFIEMQVDENDGSVWIMIHCGSRGYGWQTANHFFYLAAAELGLPSNQREKSHLRVDSTLGKKYWAYHNSAANYAIANRHTIVEGVRDATKKVFGDDPEVFYEISHNLVQEETIVLPDGTTKRGFVHRKGSTRAFPAGHPDLIGTKWEHTGHPCCIPGSMYDGAAILYAKGNIADMSGAYRTGCSVNHGSGRKMARGEAKRKLKHKQEFIDDQMKNVQRKLGGTMIRGIVGNNKKTPLDECKHVYKDLDDVLQVLVDERVAEVAHRMYPVANLKGTD
jgi:tRNA-splicing ligase RtcB